MVDATGGLVMTGSFNLPASGGGWFRLWPYAVTRWMIGHVNRRDQQAAFTDAVIDAGEGTGQLGARSTLCIKQEQALLLAAQQALGTRPEGLAGKLAQAQPVAGDYHGEQRPQGQQQVDHGNPRWW